MSARHGDGARALNWPIIAAILQGNQKATEAQG
jgi:hypothetical protein